jgi:hypothetical protein
VPAGTLQQQQKQLRHYMFVVTEHVFIYIKESSAGRAMPPQFALKCCNCQFLQASCRSPACFLQVPCNPPSSFLQIS